MESKGAIVMAVLASGLLHLAVGATGWPRLDRSTPSVTELVEVELLPPPDAPSAPQPRLASLPRPARKEISPEPRAAPTSPSRPTTARPQGSRPSRRQHPAPLREASGAATPSPLPGNEPGPGLSGQTRTTEQPNLRVSQRPVEPAGAAIAAEAPAAPAAPGKEEELPEVRGGAGGSGTLQLGPRIGVGRSGLTSALGLPNPLGAPEPRAPGPGNGAGSGPGVGAGSAASTGKGTGVPGGGGSPGGAGEGGRERPRNAERVQPERPSAPPPRNERPATTPVVPQPEPSPAKPEPVKPEPVEPLLQARARYRRNPAPDYPDEARRRRQEGVVLLRVQVSAKGRVEGVEVERSSGAPSLDQAATRAVRRWEFEPARRGDTPVASTVTVPVRFRLDRE